ncbi:MAG: hypothetical protein ACRD1H_09375 [Vicinamibacterales bacterium]
MVPDALRERWDGRYWRRWTLLAGGVLTAISAALATGVAAILGEERTPLVLLVLMLELAAISALGSGMFDGLAGRAIAGGLARQPAEDQRGRRSRLSDSDRARRDRRTIRAGVLALPLLMTFGALMFG